MESGTRRNFFEWCARGSVAAALALGSGKARGEVLKSFYDCLLGPGEDAGGGVFSF